MRILADYNLEELKDLVKGLGEPEYRAKQIYTAIYEGKAIDEVTTIPKALKEKLDSVTTGIKIREKITSRDGTIKYLFELNDSNIIEGVLMNYKHGNTICISTQVGCRMNCIFCASGLNGLVRNLTAGELVGQVVAVNRDIGGTIANREITNIVLMGSGEPLDNYYNVIKFLRLITSNESINFSPRNISLSTCGIEDKMLKFADEGINVNLTLSLHAPNDKLREELMPINKANSVKSIMNAARKYFAKTGRRVIVEYALIDGVNDSDFLANQLTTLVKGFPCHINLIKLNYVKEKNLRGSKRTDEFMKILLDNKASVTLRRTMGTDIEGACGQLRRRYLEEQ